MNKLIKNYLNRYDDSLRSLKESSNKEIILASKKLVKAFRNKKKLLICGNGGSASDAQHFAAELVGRFKKDRLSLPALALNTDTSAITAIGNDYNFDKIFSRQIEGLGMQGDVLFAISTSGKSKNIINAAIEAKKKNILVIGLTGSKSSKLEKESDICIKASSEETCHIQEIHIIIIHLLCVLIENELLK